METRIAYTIHVAVDTADLKKAAAEHDPGWQPSLGPAFELRTVAVRGHLGNGVALVRDVTLKVEGDAAVSRTYMLTVTVDVVDPRALIEAACEQYVANWQDGTWRPASLEDAARELFSMSNDMPAPVDLGFQYLPCPDVPSTLMDAAAEWARAQGLEPGPEAFDGYVAATWPREGDDDNDAPVRRMGSGG